MEPTDPLDAALAFARRGWAVFPCYEATDAGCACPRGADCTSPGKHPRTPNGVKGATTDEAQIRAWWRRWPAANVAIATGAVSGIDVIDLDAKSGGLESLQRLLEQNGDLPDTVAAETGGGGLHLYMRSAGMKSTAGLVGDGIDVRGAGGYVIAPPSLHSSGGAYRFVSGRGPGQVEPAEVPAWFVALARRRRERTMSVPAPSPGAWAPPEQDEIAEQEAWAKLEHLESEDLRAAVGRMRRGEALFPPGQHEDPIWRLVSAVRFKLPTVSDATLLRMFAPSVEAMLAERERAEGNPCRHDLAHVAAKLQKANAEYGARLAQQEQAAAAMRGVLGQKGPADPSVAAEDSDLQLADYQLTDLGNAERFRDQHRGKLLFVPKRGWFAWDGTRWAPDEGGVTVRRCAHETIRAMKRISAEMLDREAAGKLFKHANRSESHRGIENLVAVAKDLLAEPATALDADPFLLNVPNGTIDLRTGQLRPHQQSDLITKLAPVPFNPEARCPKFEAFLVWALPDDDLREFVHRLLGYCITGDVREQILAFAWGPGGNGKSVLFGTIQRILGDYAGPGAPDLLLAKHGESHPTELADLEGLRLVICQETEKGRALAEARIKALTGGDRIKARRMGQDFTYFDPTAKFILVSNPKPRIRGTDHGIRRRLRLIPFLTRVTDETRDPLLTEKLWEEAPGILAWLVRGCLAWQAKGLPVPKAVRDATDAYQHEQDQLGEFIEETCDLLPDEWEPIRDLYNEYRRWCETRGERPQEIRGFGDDLAEREGLIRRSQRRDGKFSRGIAGIRLKRRALITSAPAPVIPIADAHRPSAQEGR